MKRKAKTHCCRTLKTSKLRLSVYSLLTMTLLTPGHLTWLKDTTWMPPGSHAGWPNIICKQKNRGTADFLLVAGSVTRIPQGSLQRSPDSTSALGKGKRRFLQLLVVNKPLRRQVLRVTELHGNEYMYPFLTVTADNSLHPHPQLKIHRAVNVDNRK